MFSAGKTTPSRLVDEPVEPIQQTSRLRSISSRIPTSQLTSTKSQTRLTTSATKVATTSAKTSRTKKKSLLVLGTSKDCEGCEWKHQTIKLNDQLEQVNTSFVFSTPIVDSCSVTWRGEQLIFGGESKRQISKIDKGKVVVTLFCSNINHDILTTSI